MEKDRVVKMKFNLCHMCHIKNCKKDNCIQATLFILGFIIIMSGFFILMYGINYGMKPITERILSLYMWVGLILIFHVMIKLAIYPSYKETKENERTAFNCVIISTLLMFSGFFLTEVNINLSGILIGLSIIFMSLTIFIKYMKKR